MDEFLKLFIQLSPLFPLIGLIFLVFGPSAERLKRAFIVAQLSLVLSLLAGVLGYFLIDRDSGGSFQTALIHSVLFVVQSIGFIVVRFSYRYLNGDVGQARFLALLVGCLVSAQNLILADKFFVFIIFWFVVSIFIHQLLQFYPERPRAKLCAQKKFAISRIGDVALIIGFYLLGHSFNIWSFSDLQSSNLDLLRSVGPFKFELAAVLISLGALTKSAQLPFHSWLPDSLETPTPVSALMHAGIINGGGFLLLRMVPMFQQISSANILVSIIGALTAVFGMSVMITQSTVKRRLAYSTIGQMGFMMLECGLGFYSLALLHIVAHAFYKAYAFLRSGSAVEQIEVYLNSKLSVAQLALILGLVSLASLYFGYSRQVSLKESILLMLWLMSAAQIFVSSLALSKGKFGQMIVGLTLFLSIFAVHHWTSLFFTPGFQTIDRDWLLSLPPAVAVTFTLAIGAVLSLGLLVQLIPFASYSTPLIHSFYVHLNNGFYLGSFSDRLVKKFLKTTPLNYPK